MQQLVLEAYSGPGTESCRTPDLVQEPNSESRECHPAYHGHMGGLQACSVGLVAATWLQAPSSRLGSSSRVYICSSSSLPRIPRLLWPCDPGHGKAAEWPHVQPGCPSWAQWHFSHSVLTAHREKEEKEETKLCRAQQPGPEAGSQAPAPDLPVLHPHRSPGLPRLPPCSPLPSHHHQTLGTHGPFSPAELYHTPEAAHL